MKPCLEPGCPDLAPKGTSHCPTHRPEPFGGGRNRPSFRARYGISQSEWQKIRRRAMRRDRRRCVLCGNRATQVDHIIPVSAGGSNAMTNLQSLCEPCHKTKTVDDRRVH